jgi:hypothetical protein
VLLTDEQIAESQVVKYAAATEENGILTAKIAGAEPAPITPEQLSGFRAYMQEIKDAGVQIVYVNQDADWFRASIKIWYNPSEIDNRGISIIGGNEPVRETIENFLSSLPFNGQFRQDKLVDAIQQVPGVVTVIVPRIETSTTGAVWEQIEGIHLPMSGYYKVWRPEDLIIEYLPA